MAPLNTKKESTPAQIRLVVEVDGNPVGFLSLDLDRLWPLINHHRQNTVPVEWMDQSTFDSVMRAVVMKSFLSRLQGRLYQALGDEMVKAELDAESFALKAEDAAHVFGQTKADIEKLVAESGRTEADFDNFFWQYLLEDGEVSDLKKGWKTKDIPPR